MIKNDSRGLGQGLSPVKPANLKITLSDDERWEALLQRDSRVSSPFVYGVLTTGVYCRSACPSRLPNRDNVRFFENRMDAEQAGFRPCKRCKPDAQEPPHTLAVLQACKRMDEADTPPSLKQLAQVAGLSPFHFQRLFKKMVGVTPKQYAMEKLASRLRTNLEKDSTITGAMYAAGFASSSRFYEKAAATLGMKPSTYKNGAQGVQIRFATAPCFLGFVLVGATAQGICAIDFGDTAEALKENLRRRFPKAVFQNPDPRFNKMIRQVLAFLEEPHRSRLDLPLDVQGTAFQRRVWMALQAIPAGDTMTYSEIAARIGKPKATRAVARACAANTLAVAVPCHRVVRGDGQLGGYRWGLERKRLLLERERKEGYRDSGRCSANKVSMFKEEGNGRHIR